MSNTCRLDDIVSAVDDKTVLEKDPTLPYVGLEHIGRRGAGLNGTLQASASISTNAIFKAGDVLFGKLRPNLRKSALASFDGYCSTDILVLRPKSGISPRFAAKIFQTERVGSIAEMTAAGTKMPRTSWRQLRDLEVFCPNIESQRDIADVLDILDATIRQTEEIIKKLKQVKQGVLHDLLTRGIDANGELRPPQSQAPHLYKNSPLGWIPKQWDCAPTSARCSLITKGTTPAAENMWQGDDGVRFLRVDNLSFDGHFNFFASRFRISPETHSGELGRSKCLPGDVLTNIVGPPLGKLGLVMIDTGEININQAIALLRPNDELLSAFLLLWLSSAMAQLWLRSRAKQTSGQVNLTLALCRELPIPDMCLDEQQRIVDRIEVTQGRIILEESELAKLRELKSGLMDDLLTGRVRVTPLLNPIENPA